MSDSDVRKDYVDAVIKVKVPKWQIGEKVFIYFPDTMAINGICEVETHKMVKAQIPVNEHLRCIRCGRVLKSPDSKERGYGDICWEKHLKDAQSKLF